MTIQREYAGGPFVVQCNECLDTEELEGESRQEAVKDARERGYTAHFEERRWTCRICTKTALKASQEAFQKAEDEYEQTKLEERRAA